MEILPDRPAGIDQGEEFEGVRLSWKLPGMGMARLIFAPCFALGSVLWAAGLASGLGQVARSGFAVGSVVAVAGWFAFGLWLPLGLWASLRRRPESVILGRDELAYDPGWDATSPVFLAGVMLGPGSPRRIRPLTVPKAGFAAELAGGRLVIPVGGATVEVGMGLPEAEKGWLFAALEAWRRA